MAKSKPPRIVDLPDEDSPLEQFLQKAAPILAAQRGINAKSRVLLSAVAHDVDLPEDQFEEAMRSLQGAPPVSKDSQEHDNPYFEAFTRYLHAKLVKLPRGILTAPIEERAIAIAKSHFHIEADLAQQAIRDVSTARGIRRVSRAAAQQYVEDLVADKVEDASWIDDATADRLRAVGREWGLTADEVDKIVNQHTKKNRLRQNNEKKLIVTGLAVAGVLVFGLLTFYVVWINSSDPPKTTKTDDKNETSKEGSPPKLPKRRIVSVQPPDWWNIDLTVALGNARRGILPFKPIYSRMAASSPVKRSAAYRQLMTLCLKDSVEKEHRMLLSDILSACYALDPEEQSIAALRGDLLTKMRFSDDNSLPSKAVTVLHAFWAVETTLIALKSEGLSDGRQQTLLDSLSRGVGLRLTGEEDRKELMRTCQESLAKRLHRQITLAAPKQPKQALLFHEALSNLTVLLLPREQYERLNIDFLTAALPAAGDDWKEFQELIKKAIYSNDPLNILKVVRLYERSNNEDLQQYMAEFLQLKTKVGPLPDTVAERAAAFRNKLGVKEPEIPKTAQDRWQTLRKKATTALAASTPNDPEELLRQTVTLAHLATLGHAAAQRELGFVLFDELIEKDPLAPTDDEAKKEGEGTSKDDVFERILDATPKRPLTKSQRESMNRHFSNMKNFRGSSPSNRLNTFRTLADYSKRHEEIKPAEGKLLVNYLLAAKDNNEFERSLDSAGIVSRWKYVRLALADSLHETKLSKEQMGQLLSKVLKRDFDMNNSQWIATAQNGLLRSVLDDFAALPPPEAGGKKSQEFQRAGDALQVLYRARGNLLGVPTDRSDAAASPSQSLKLLVETTASKIDGTAKTPRQRQFLAELPHRMTAFEYLAGDDLRHTVAMQRLWLQTLAIDTTRRRAGRASQANQLIDDLQQRDIESKDLLTQLKDGEATTLKMWLLHAP